MNYTTGDIVTARVNSLPILFHKGIIINDSDSLFVYHNTPTGKNQFGGSIVKETLESFTKTRKIISSEKAGIDYTKIKQLSYDLRFVKFNLLNFNCEQYVSLIKENTLKSPQLLFWTMTILVSCFIRKRK